MDAGATLRDWRKRAGLSQTELALRAGTHQSVVSRIEARRVSPSVDTLDLLLRACGAGLEAAAVSDRDEELLAEIRRLLDLPTWGRLRPAPITLLRYLLGARLRFVLVGDWAMLAQAAPPPSPPAAVEIVLDPREANRRRFVMALRRLGVPLPPLLERGPIPRARKVTARTRYGLLVAARPPWHRPFPNLVAPSTAVDLEASLPLLVAAPADLIGMELEATAPSPRLRALLVLREELARRRPPVGGARPRRVEWPIERGIPASHLPTGRKEHRA